MGKTIIGVVKAVHFTRGAFGEQWWEIDDGKGEAHAIAMWMDAKSSLWARCGETVKVKLTNDVKIYHGGGTYTRIAPCGEIVERFNV